MEFLELCKQRYSVRDYTAQPVEREKLEYILEAARMAPSAVNFQPCVYIVVREKENREKLHECYHREWFTTAPCYIIIGADLSQSWKRKVDNKEFGEIDAAIAIEHICLAAAEQGLGSCWVCNFNPTQLKRDFKFPEHITPVAILSIGYPSDTICNQVSKVRKPITEIVRWEEFS